MLWLHASGGQHFVVLVLHGRLYILAGLFCQLTAKEKFNRLVSFGCRNQHVKHELSFGVIGSVKDYL